MSPDSARAAGEAVLERLRAEALRYGVELPGLAWESAQFNLQRDPVNGLDALLARWQCAGRSVQLVLRPDGHVYGECDLLIDHPARLLDGYAGRLGPAAGAPLRAEPDPKTRVSALVMFATRPPSRQRRLSAKQQVASVARALRCIA